MRINTPQKAPLIPTDTEVTTVDLTAGQTLNLCVTGSVLTDTYLAYECGDINGKIELSIGDSGYVGYEFVAPIDGTYTFTTDSTHVIVLAERGEADAELAASLDAVPASPKITMTPYSDMYCGVRYKANGTLLQSRCSKNTPISFGESITEVFNDTETAIFGASELSSLDSLAGLYLSVLNTSSASKLTKLLVGNHDPRYRNSMLREINVGANKLLKVIDITNCVRLNQSLGMSNCDNIEEIYALGTSITGVALPSAGYLKVLHVPNTLNELIITNHPELKTSNVKIGDTGLETENITRLCIANCPELDGTAIFKSCLTTNTKLARVRLTDVNWTDWTVADLQKLYTSKDKGGYGLRGLDANNSNSDTINISGVCTLSENVAGEVMADLVKNLPYLQFKMASGYKVKSIVTFMNNDGTKVLWTETLETSETQNITCPDPTDRMDEKPTRESSAQYHYTHNGWSIQPAINRVPQEDALKNILGNRTLYPSFSETLRDYTYQFVTVDRVMYSGKEYYGNKVTFELDKVTDDELLITETDGDVVPKKYDSAKPDAYEFTGWYPSTDDVIVGDTTFYAQYVLSTNAFYEPVVADIKYITNEDKLTITKYLNTNAPIVSIPETYTLEQTTYTTDAIVGYDGADTNVTGFADTNVELVVIPDTVTRIGPEAFRNAHKLAEVTIGEGVTSIQDSAFKYCTALDVVRYNAVDAAVNRTNTNYSDNYPFDGCNTTTGFELVVGPEVTHIPDYLCNVASHSTGKSVVASIDFSNAPKCKTIGTGAFYNCDLRELNLGDNVELIKTSAFVNNTNIKELVLTNGLKRTMISAFQEWEALEKVHIPASLTQIDSGTFRYCENLTDFVVESGSKYKVLGNALVDGTTNTIIVGTQNTVIDSSIEGIAGYAFAGCTKLTRIVIPYKITMLNTDTFAGCTNLSEIVFSDDLTHIGNQCFYDCKSLTSVKLPENLQRIETVGFGHSGLKTVDIPASVTSLGLYAFMGCSDLTKVTIRNPNGIHVDKTIYGEAKLFTSCTKLKTINVGWTRDTVVDGITMNDQLYLWDIPDPETVTINYQGEWED
jgi:hypothetical protein